MELYIFFQMKNETTNIAINKQKFVQNSLFSESSHLSQMKLEKFFQMKVKPRTSQFLSKKWIQKFFYHRIFFCLMHLQIFYPMNSETTINMRKWFWFLFVLVIYFYATASRTCKVMSVGPSVCRSFCLSVRLSVGPSVGPSSTFLKF